MGKVRWFVKKQSIKALKKVGEVPSPLEHSLEQNNITQLCVLSLKKALKSHNSIWYSSFNMGLSFYCLHIAGFFFKGLMVSFVVFGSELKNK